MNAPNHGNIAVDGHDAASEVVNDDDLMIFNIRPRRDVPVHSDGVEYVQADTAQD